MSIRVSLNAMGLMFIAALLVAQAQQQPELVTPTFAKFHAKTQEQQVKARFFDRLARPLQPNTKSSEDFEHAGPPRNAPEYEAYLRKAVCQADLVVLGRPLSHQSFVTAHESSIFTDYAFAVEQWLRGSVTFDRPAASTAITVTLRGGNIDTDAGPVEVENEDPLTPGRKYIVFLKQIPETSSYQLSAPTLVAASVATSMRAHQDVPESLIHGDKATSILITDIQRFAGTCGARGGGR